MELSLRLTRRFSVRQQMRCLTLAILVLAFPGSGFAQDSGRPILTVAGPESAASTDFDLAQLESIGIETVVTTTPWTDGKLTFQGVRLSKVMATASAAGRDFTAVALNDYVARIPYSDVEEYDPLLAIRMNGAAMPVRDKGPIWLIYPDDVADHSNPEIRDRMVWQLRRIEVR